jgi:hypothetical protein
MFAYTMEHLFSYSATLRAPPEAIGPIPEGIRANFYITGGKLLGPKLKGKLLPVGGDAFLMRHDGVGQLNVQATFETEDGALIDATYGGIADFGADGYEKFLRSQLPKKVALRTTPRLRTAHPAYQWLHRLHCVGIGEADLEQFVVSYDVYAVR